MRQTVATVLIILTLGSFHAMATPPDSLVSAANEAYNKGDWDLARELYLSVASQGYTSAELFYNLGNACFKDNDMPSAILYYEKARKFSPKDEDINFNLSLANSRIIDKIEPVPEFFLRKWWNGLLQVTGPDGWARAVIVLFVLFLVALGAFILANALIVRKFSFWTGMVLLILCLFAFVAGGQSYSKAKNQTEGIIFTPTVVVKSSPSDNSVDLFVIHEGTKVRILDRLEQWSEVRIANGSVGWVRTSDYEAI